jgi:hypothetical protein
MNKFNELKKELRRSEYCFDKRGKKTIEVSLLGLIKEATELNKNEVLIKVIKDNTGLLENKEDFISSNTKELLEVLIPVSIDFPDISHIGTLIYNDQFSVKEAIDYIKKYLENRGEEINFIREKFNTLLNKENIDKKDLKIFQNYLILNNKSHK